MDNRDQEARPCTCDTRRGRTTARRTPAGVWSGPPHKAALETHLRERLGEFFNLDDGLLLYDMTSTYFEGHASANALAQRGHSSDLLPDCKQVCIALVVTDGGPPLGHEIFAGNRVGVTTVEEIVTAMETRHGKAKRISVMDRGMVSADNMTRFEREVASTW